jgi:N-acetylglutamate synthase-like GNAT family acetyltransferase
MQVFNFANMKEYVVNHPVTTEKELEILKAFLNANQLPADDLTFTNSLLLVYYNTHEMLVGSGGLEFYNDYALLRSLAVSPELRGQQLGKQIVADLLKFAQEQNIREIYLLTQTASFFFQKLGFKQVNRELVPDAIKKSSEFATVCPTSAEVLMLKLN